MGMPTTSGARAYFKHNLVTYLRLYPVHLNYGPSLSFFPNNQAQYAGDLRQSFGAHTQKNLTFTAPLVYLVRLTDQAQSPAFSFEAF
jgi:hypothetical protein